MNPDVKVDSQTVLGSIGGSKVAEPSLRHEGSLPFKKRKLYRSGGGSASEPKSPYSIGSVARAPSFGGSDDEKIAALALVAASSSALPISNASFPGLQLSPISINQHNQQMRVFQDETKRESIASHASSELSGPQEVPVAPHADTKPKNKLRVQHPPLRSPLPGGCHGRTARNSSYCRRTPCYNGSKYCKLHYQMNMVSSKSQDSGGVSVVETTPSPAAHTDKRFQGLDGEVKCCATTTRGRPCTYISVNGTKYCFLHADYESNPPPRRGSNTSSLKKRAASVSSGAESLSGDDSSTSEGHRGTILFKTPNSKPPASITSDKSSLSSSAWVTPQASSVSDSSTTRKKTKNVSTRDGKPLLSSLSYDQWYDKKVCVSTGPMANHKGRVVKWSNGWVTVRLESDELVQEDNALLHNRRAVELYLVPDEAEEAASMVPHDVEMGDRTSQLLRCVSREIEATASESDLVRSRLDTVSPSEHSGSQADTRDFVDVPVENVAVANEVVSNGERPSEAPTAMVGAKPNAPDEVLDSPNPSAGSAKIDPTGEDSPPLVKSLLLAQEQGLRKEQGLDLLFGTAALERGRRKINRPARYEDTAMIEKPRSRQSSESHVLTPRKRTTPVLSPRSPGN